MFYEIMQEFWRSLLSLPDLETDYLTTISAVMIVFVLLTLFLGLFCRANLSKVLIIVLVTLSVFFVTDHYFERKTEISSDVFEGLRWLLSQGSKGEAGTRLFGMKGGHDSVEVGRSVERREPIS